MGTLLGPKSIPYTCMDPLVDYGNPARESRALDLAPGPRSPGTQTPDCTPCCRFGSFPKLGVPFWGSLE